MPLLETVLSVVTASTAKAVTKFLYQKVEDYIKKKFKNDPPYEMQELKDNIKAIRSQLASQDNSKIQENTVETCI